MVALLVSFTVFAALVLPTAVDEKLNEVGETDTAVAAPVRLITTLELKNPLSLMVTVPVKVPLAVGLKMMFIEQLWPECGPLPQSSASENGPTEVTMLLMVNGPAEVRGNVLRSADRAHGLNVEHDVGSGRVENRHCGKFPNEIVAGVSNVNIADRIDADSPGVVDFGGGGKDVLLRTGEAGAAITGHGMNKRLAIYEANALVRRIGNGHIARRIHRDLFGVTE